MSEGKRSQEEKGWQKLLSKVLKFVPILCIIAVVVFFVILFDMKNKVDNGNVVKNNTVTNTNTVVTNTNTNTNINNNVVNNNVETNTTTENNQVIEGSIVNNNQNTESKPPISKPDDEPDIAQAKAIFNDFWGEDNNSNIDVYKNSSGEYIVRVTSMQTGINQFFKVDISSKNVSEY